MFLDLPPKAKEIKEKINKCDLINLKATHSKGNHWQNKRKCYWIGENICKWYGQ